MILYSAAPIISILGYFIPFFGVFVLFLKAKIIQQDSKFHNLMFNQFMLYYSTVDPASIVKRASGRLLLNILNTLTNHSAWVFSGLGTEDLHNFKSVFQRNLEHLENAERHSEEVQKLFKSRIDRDPIRKSMSVTPMPVREVD